METTTFRSYSEEFAAYFEGLSDGRMMKWSEYAGRRIPEGADREYDRGFAAGTRGR